MSLLPRIVLATILLLAVVVQSVDGYHNIVHVSELINDDKDFITSGEYDSSLICCVHGNCSCGSLDHALANLSNNVLINVTTDATLSLLVKLSDLENVSITGHNNPTVNCRNIGGMHLNFCHNCIIQGITWDGCGTKNTDNHSEPVLMLSYCSNVTIRKCSFQHSVGEAVVLYEILGNLNILSSNFVNNSCYRGHGAAIHYSSNNVTKSSKFVLTIDNCNFSYNVMKSLVYLENRLLKYNKVVISNCSFCSNQGTPVYATNHNIYWHGNNWFHKNIAENGAGIYISDYSTVTFGENSDVKFVQNSASHKGGTVYLRNHSICLFDRNSRMTFDDNKATNGTIYSEDSCNITFKASCKVTFKNNSVIQYGAAIYSIDNSHVIFTGNAKVTFNSNVVRYKYVGGILYSGDKSSISFEGNSTTTFSDNSAYHGGAIYSNNNSCISFGGNCDTMFSTNTAVEGGAINSYNSSHIFFKGNSTTIFRSNIAEYGGAVFSNDNNYISVEGNPI